nr:plexin-C1 [Nothobranchius furzeri]
MILLLGLIWSLWGEPARCLQEDGGFTFSGDILHITVATDDVYIATEEKLYQLSHDLVLTHSLTQRGMLKDLNQNTKKFHRVSEKTRGNATFRVNVFLPFTKNNSLISCGVIESTCGYCEILDMKNISNLMHGENIQVGPLERSSASVSFLVDVKKNPTVSETYILAAVQQDKAEQGKSDPETIKLLNTDDSQHGNIFSGTEQTGTHVIRSRGKVEFVDGFQINSTVYLFSNVDSGTKNNKVRLLWFEAKSSKRETFNSLRGATLRISGDEEGSRLLASSIIRGGQQVLWSGVFSVDGGATRTELVLFDISPDLSRGTDTDPDFYPTSKTSVSQSEPKILKPKAVLFKKDYMTSVLAERKMGWMVFFIGTSDGQLLRLSVDRNLRPTCPKVLYRASGDVKLLPQIYLDPVDHEHVYVSVKNQVNRVPVSECNTHTDKKACWSAQDPYCVWCVDEKRCTREDECKGSDWLSIPDESQKKMISHRVVEDPKGQIKVTIQAHLTVKAEMRSNFSCQFSTTSGQLCMQSGSKPHYPQCTCILSTHPVDGVDVTVRIRVGAAQLTEKLHLINCSNIQGEPSDLLCQRCITAGCGWRDNSCSWASPQVQSDSICTNITSEVKFSKPEISSITPSNVSFYGKNHAVLSGRDLQDVIGVKILKDLSCSPQESPVWNKTGVNLTFHIPSTNAKGAVKVCVLLPDGSCHGNAEIIYQSAPICSGIVPSSSWISGKRKVTLHGTNLYFVDGITHDHMHNHAILPRTSSYQNLTYETPAAEKTQKSFVSMRVANETLSCTQITYYKDPEFTSFSAVREGKDVRIVIQKKADELNMSTAELSVWGIREEEMHFCSIEGKESSSEIDSISCEIKGIQEVKFNQLEIRYGDKSIKLSNSSSNLIFMLFALLLIPVIVAVVVVVYQSKQKKLTAKMNRLIEDLELDIRKDIRQGFVDLQTEKADLMENVGAIPFLDYKHFASRIFFPESDRLIRLCIKDIGQDVVTVKLDEGCQSLSKLIQDQLFLTSVVHALEEQKSFTIKDKCSLASLLTVALHSNLLYLTNVMEVLLEDLMHQNSNSQPKLLLRRTQSTVEKLLTNWMSICLYGFLRESVGQHLFLLVSALTQQISKGPVDCVTEKALYTLSEDWLLWKAQDFSPLKLQVLFAVGRDGEVSQPLEVNALSCDTVEQLKEKILSTFRAKFGFPYETPIRDVCVEYEKHGSFVPLQDVDASSEVIGDMKKLNTLKYYQISDGAAIKVISKKDHPPLSPQTSLKDDENFSGKYFHLIDPDVVEDQAKSPERKKLNLKELHLTKLLSTKVAVHSYVENLFNSIWGMPQSKAPHAVKYFFDFLDARADNMKISDPDVRHIWKTNSLPLRFWVNILKNPQFVFDMEKTPHLDGCLSVIAQAFMDCFSLSEIQLGKHAPTNKLLYAKDIPKFKQEVKVYYKQIRDQQPVTDTEFKNFLQEESKKHENEFNEAAALKELYKFIQQYFTQIKEKLSQNAAPAELVEQLHHVKDTFDGLKSCSWSC